MMPKTIVYVLEIVNVNVGDGQRRSGGVASDDLGFGQNVKVAAVRYLSERIVKCARPFSDRLFSVRKSVFWPMCVLKVGAIMIVSIDKNLWRQAIMTQYLSLFVLLLLLVWCNIASRAHEHNRIEWSDSMMEMESDLANDVD
jgi:hypothetical protein